MTRRRMTAAPPSSPATLIQTTQTLQEALGELAQRALCSADPAAVSDAVALMAHIRVMLSPPPRH